MDLSTLFPAIQIAIQTAIQTARWLAEQLLPSVAVYCCIPV